LFLMEVEHGQMIMTQKHLLMRERSDDYETLTHLFPYVLTKYGLSSTPRLIGIRTHNVSGDIH
jgi:hypothetical protein